MKRTVLISIVAMLAGILVTTQAAAATKPSPFIGVWQGIDVTDGSLMTFTLSGNGHFVLYDQHAQKCFTPSGASGAPITLKGTATIAGTTLTWTALSARCEDGSVPFSVGGSSEFFYKRATDTMFSTVASWGQKSTWHRIRR